MNILNLIISDEASSLVEAGFSGFNGCGSGKLSKVFCSLLLMPFSKKVMEDLENCWFIHDAEYTISTSKKSKAHKKLADDSLAKNMLTVLTKHKKDGSLGILVISIIHTALVVGGNSAYWRKKASGGWSIYKVLIILLVLNEIIKVVS